MRVTLELAKTIHAPSSRRKTANRVCVLTKHRVGKHTLASYLLYSDVMLKMVNSPKYDPQPHFIGTPLRFGSVTQPHSYTLRSSGVLAGASRKPILLFWGISSKLY